MIAIFLFPFLFFSTSQLAMEVASKKTSQTQQLQSHLVDLSQLPKELITVINTFTMDKFNNMNPALTDYTEKEVKSAASNWSFGTVLGQQLFLSKMRQLNIKDRAKFFKQNNIKNLGATLNQQRAEQEKKPIPDWNFISMLLEYAFLLSVGKSKKTPLPVPGACVYKSVQPQNSLEFFEPVACINEGGEKLEASHKFYINKEVALDAKIDKKRKFSDSNMEINLELKEKIIGIDPKGDYIAISDLNSFKVILLECNSTPPLQISLSRFNFPTTTVLEKAFFNASSRYILCITKTGTDKLKSIYLLDQLTLTSIPILKTPHSGVAWNSNNCFLVVDFSGNLLEVNAFTSEQKILYQGINHTCMQIAVNEKDAILITNYFPEYKEPCSCYSLLTKNNNNYTRQVANICSYGGIIFFQDTKWLEGGHWGKTWQQLNSQGMKWQEIKDSTCDKQKSYPSLAPFFYASAIFVICSFSYALLLYFLKLYSTRLINLTTLLHVCPSSQKQ